MTTKYQKLGERVKELRKDRGLSQEQLAEMVKCDVRTIVAIEGGKRNPTLDTMNKIAKAVNADIKDLF
ncbi:MAG: helix-turn-helix transcriptional regulator [Candidatus Shapirobacteria bacterium]|nr:helix-turn-helix transcriptional regulator [Candidatus Shapirobacteria bacterium]